MGALAVSLVLTLTSCATLLNPGDANKPPRIKGDDITIGLLLPEKETARYEKFDRPVIEQQVKELTHGKGTLLYANAEQDADKQKAQLQRMVADKDHPVDTIIIDAVDAKAIGPDIERAKNAGVHIIAYDRLAEGPIDGFVTFDGALVGAVQGQALLEALDDDDPGSVGAKGRTKQIVMMNGAPTDPNAATFKKAALGELHNDVTIAATYDTEGWKPDNARANMAAAIEELGVTHIDAVYSANDGMASGIIKALKDAGVTKLPPITGQDAELPAVQRIVSGEQYMTVYKPYREEATVAARMAVNISQNRMIAYDALVRDRTHSATTKNIPLHLVPVRPLTQESIRSTVLQDEIYTVKEICTRAYRAQCREIGLLK